MSSFFLVLALDVQAQRLRVILLKDAHPAGINGVRGINFPVPQEQFSWFLGLHKPVIELEGNFAKFNVKVQALLIVNVDN